MNDYELRQHDLKIAAIENNPLADRKEAKADYFTAISLQPSIVAERVGWIFDGSYGSGLYEMAWELAGNKRRNRIAQLGIWIAAYEYDCPQREAAAAYNMLTKEEKESLNIAIDNAMSRAIAEREEQESIDNA